MLFRKMAIVAGSLIVLTSITAIETTVAETPSSKISLTQNDSTKNYPEVSVSHDAEADFDYIDLPSVIRNENAVVQSSANEVVTGSNETVSTNEDANSTSNISIDDSSTSESSVIESPASRIINVSLAGGQNVVDMGAGPVLFPLPAGFPQYVAEHDYAGGWDRIGTLTVGTKVTMTGLVTGDYTVGQTINVPKGSRTSTLVAFDTMPNLLLQTCIPGTNMMVVVGLY